MPEVAARSKTTDGVSPVRDVMQTPDLCRAVSRTAALALVAVTVTLSASAQTNTMACAESITTAEQLYLEQLYDDVEAQVLECVYAEGAPKGDVQAAYRLLALTQIKQGEIEAARATVVKLLGVDFAYEPEPLADLPIYVALVGVVKDQLRVEAVPAGQPEGARPGLPAPAEGPAASRIDINTATEAELQGARGIGPAIARRIVEFRERNGPFRTVDDLDDVRGIGPATLERMRPYLTVRGATIRMSAGGGVAAASPTETPAARPVLVNLNTATAQELESLDGIGPALAQRIIAYRTANGPFRTLEALMEVRGIGPGKLEAVRGAATVD